MGRDEITLIARAAQVDPPQASVVPVDDEKLIQILATGDVTRVAAATNCDVFKLRVRAARLETLYSGTAVADNVDPV